MITEGERRLLERLASEGKPARLFGEEVSIAKTLERSGLVCLVGALAVVTPKARRLLAMTQDETRGTVLRAF
jgi:hypothetical protein